MDAVGRRMVVSVRPCYYVKELDKKKVKKIVCTFFNIINVLCFVCFVLFFQMRFELFVPSSNRPGDQEHFDPSLHSLLWSEVPSVNKTLTLF